MCEFEYTIPVKRMHSHTIRLPDFGERIIRQPVQIHVDPFQFDVHRTFAALLECHAGYVQRIDRHQIDARITFGQFLDQHR